MPKRSLVRTALGLLGWFAVTVGVGLLILWFGYPASWPHGVGQFALVVVVVTILCIPTQLLAFIPLGRDDLSWADALWNETGCAPVLLGLVLPIVYVPVCAAILHKILN